MALGGTAIRREATVAFGAGAPKLNLLIYLPRSGRKRWPVMLGPNYLGNHTVHPDPGITLPDIAFVAGMDVALPEGRATEASRGFHASRWPVERIVERGYAVATFYLWRRVSRSRGWTAAQRSAAFRRGTGALFTIGVRSRPGLGG